MRTGPCVCGATLRMPDEMSLWRLPMALHVQSEQHQLWRARRPAWAGTPRLYEEHLGTMLGRPAAEPRASVVSSPASTSGSGGRRAA